MSQMAEKYREIDQDSETMSEKYLQFFRESLFSHLNEKQKEVAKIEETLHQFQFQLNQMQQTMQQIQSSTVASERKLYDFPLFPVITQPNATGICIGPFETNCKRSVSCSLLVSSLWQEMSR